jgi:hypothetical protein
MTVTKAMAFRSADRQMTVERHLEVDRSGLADDDSLDAIRAGSAVSGLVVRIRQAVSRGASLLVYHGLGRPDGPGAAHSRSRPAK